MNLDKFILFLKWWGPRLVAIGVIGILIFFFFGNHFKPGKWPWESSAKKQWVIMEIIACQPNLEAWQKYQGWCLSQSKLEVGHYRLVSDDETATDWELPRATRDGLVVSYIRFTQPDGKFLSSFFPPDWYYSVFAKRAPLPVAPLRIGNIVARIGTGSTPFEPNSQKGFDVGVDEAGQRLQLVPNVPMEESSFLHGKGHYSLRLEREADKR